MTISSAAKVSGAVDAIGDLTELHRAGQGQSSRKLRRQRSTALPDVPTFNELGVDRGRAWGGLLLRAREAPRRIVTRSSGDHKALQSPTRGEVIRLGNGSCDRHARNNSPRIWLTIYAKWGPIVKASGFKPE